jgi:hypothetical protein
MEYVDDDGRVIRRGTTETMRETYERFCEGHGIDIADLDG